MSGFVIPNAEGGFTSPACEIGVMYYVGILIGTNMTCLPGIELEICILMKRFRVQYLPDPSLKNLCCL